MSMGKLLGGVVAAIVMVVVVNLAGDLVYNAGTVPGIQPGDTRGEALNETPTVTEADTGAVEAPTESTTTADAVGSPASETQIAGLIGDPDAGQKAVRACAACHTFDEGGANRVGPNLYNVVGSDVASHDGFNYSDALSGIEGDWTLEQLHGWLTDPKAFAPGNKMTYAGVKDEQTLNNIIAYLQTLQPADEVGKLGPQPAADEAAAEGAEAEEAPAAEGEAATEAPAEGEAAAEAPAEEPAAEEAQTADAGAAVAGDAAAGEKATRQCAACHTFNEGGPNRVGPNLYGTFGADIAGHEGFRYSNALQELDGDWTAEKLDAWLANPREFAPGNKMTFAGVKDETERQNLIAYLATLR